MRYYFDTEFLEDGKTIELISIGIVAEDGRELYLINEEAPWHRVINDQWLRENVVKHLPMSLHEVREQGCHQSKFFETLRWNPEQWDTKIGIKDQILEFVDQRPEFWAYYADYDWVVFCQLFGRMIDLPKGFPMYCRDLKQLIDELRIDGHMALKQNKGLEHNALDDARWVKRAYNYVRGWQKQDDSGY